MRITAEQKQDVVDFLQKFQRRLSESLQEVDGYGSFTRKDWQHAEKGGGTMAVLRSSIVEKAGVNFSQVSGSKYPNIDGKSLDKPFFATGVSSIAHMQNPYAPIGHMNVRLIEVGDEAWFGGGADLTPMHVFPEDREDFHSALRKACDSYEKDAYERFSKECDEYFYIKHRQSIRGVGGIFYDYLKGEFSNLFSFMQAVAHAYLEVYPAILNRRKNLAYSQSDKEEQLYWRGRYAEFNLVYDRGTKFGLLSGGNIEAIFVSLPPVVKW